MEEELSNIIGQVKEMQINRKLQEKILRIIERQSSENDCNNFDNTSESSDDNCIKKINKSISDKEEKYDYNKISNLNIRQEKVSEETRGFKTSNNKGAIPRKRFPQNFQSSKNNCLGGRRNRENSCESERSFLSGPRKPYVREFPKNEDRENREISIIKQVLNRDSIYDVSQRFPFYYKVPKNPVELNPLPPGTYLVIPQASINFLPLRIFSHPQADFSENNNKRENLDSFEGPKRRNSVKDNEKGGSDKDFLGKGKRRNNNNNNNNNKKQQGRKPPDKNSCDLDNNENPSTSDGSHVKPSTKEIHEIFVKSLPFYDVDKLVKEFNERRINVEKFVAEMVQRKRNEIQDKIFEVFPDVDISCLEEYITDALENFESVEDFIKDRKKRREKEFLESLGREIPEIDSELMKDIYDQYEGSEDINALVKKMEEARKEEKLVETFTLIYSILPDADPKFISKLLNQAMGDLRTLNDLLLGLLETKDYPKVKESDVKFRDKMKLWRYYVSDFTVESFLEKVPEPEATFSGLKEGIEGDKNKEAALKFLKMRYPILEEEQIKLTLSAFRGSISNTCLHLDKFGPFNNKIGDEILEEDFNELFLQEVCYCTQRKKILEFIRVEKERRELEVEVCKYEKGFLECLNCYDDEVLPSDVAACPDGHLCCKNCLIRYIQISYGSGKSEFICLSDSCDNEYGLDVLEKFIGQHLLLKITEKKAAAEVEKAGVSGLEKCPSCHYAYIPDPEDKVFRCENVDCFRITCRFCKEASHLPLSCNEVERPRDVVARKRVEEAMSKKLVRYCPGCNKGFVKTDGCNKINCSCGTKSCYLCSTVISDYSHFTRAKENTTQCPLYSNNHELHVEHVERAGKEEKEVILREDENVNFINDPTENFR